MTLDPVLPRRAVASAATIGTPATGTPLSGGGHNLPPDPSAGGTDRPVELARVAQLPAGHIRQRAINLAALTFWQIMFAATGIRTLRRMIPKEPPDWALLDPMFAPREET